jgi:hypothetical protein
MTIETLAGVLAAGHAASPEVRSAGGARASDEETFENTTPADRLREWKLPTNATAIRSLRKALRSALARYER